MDPEGEPAFSPKPTEYRVDADGNVKPTHGVSLFDDPAFIPSRLDPRRIDTSSVPEQLRIEQRGQNPAHFEIMPQVGTSLSVAEHADLLSQIRCIDE